MYMHESDMKTISNEYVSSMLNKIQLETTAALKNENKKQKQKKKKNKKEKQTHEQEEANGKIQTYASDHEKK